MRHFSDNSTARAGFWLLTVVVLVGCVTHKPKAPTLSPRFYGVWTNVNPNFHNWWKISAAGAVNYGIALDQGRCGGRSAIVLGSDQLNVPFGNAATVHLSLNASGYLVFEARHVHAFHKRVTITDICRKPDGTYFDGAPHVAAMP